MAYVYIPRIVTLEAVDYPDGRNDFSLSIRSDELLRWWVRSRYTRHRCAGFLLYRCYDE